MGGFTALLLGAGRNIVVSLLTKTFGIWLLKQAARSTKTQVDDNAIMLLEAGLDNNQENIIIYAKKIIEDAKDLL